jgi:hypothetical protein
MDRLSQTAGKEFLLYAIKRAQISHDGLVMQALVWLSMVTLRTVRFGAVQFGTSYVNFGTALYI